ncbi:MAG: hypothetical protein ABH854_04665 [Candidatus Diapherotrites archaeon]
MKRPTKYDKVFRSFKKKQLLFWGKPEELKERAIEILNHPVYGKTLRNFKPMKQQLTGPELVEHYQEMREIMRKLHQNNEQKELFEIFKQYGKQTTGLKNSFEAADAYMKELFPDY